MDLLYHKSESLNSYREVVPICYSKGEPDRCVIRKVENFHSLEDLNARISAHVDNDIRDALHSLTQGSNT